MFSENGENESSHLLRQTRPPAIAILTAQLPKITLYWFVIAQSLIFSCVPNDSQRFSSSPLCNPLLLLPVVNKPAKSSYETTCDVQLSQVLLSSQLVASRSGKLAVRSEHSRANACQDVDPGYTRSPCQRAHLEDDWAIRDHGWHRDDCVDEANQSCLAGELHAGRTLDGDILQ